MGRFKKGTNGPDTLIGTKFADKLFGKGGDDLLDGGNGNDLLVGGKGNDLIKSGAGNDFAFGGKGNDTINGGHGYDFLFGGSGDDRLTGGGEIDIMVGGRGKDEFRIDATGFKNIVVDFCYAQGDRIDIPPGYALSDATITDNGLSLFGVTVSWGSSGPVVQILGVANASDVSSAWFI